MTLREGHDADRLASDLKALADACRDRSGNELFKALAGRLREASAGRVQTLSEELLRESREEQCS